MPYASMDEVNPAIKGINPPVTLAQANIIASWADKITDVESPWPVAIANFKKAYAIEDGRWVKRATEVDMGELDEAVTKSVSGKNLPASSFLVVGDAEEVGTWHLPVKDAAGKPDHRLMGGAFAALTRGYRGQRYAGPNKAAALTKLKALYKAEDMPIPGTAEMATEALAYVGELLEDVKGLLQETGIVPEIEEEESELESLKLAETYVGVELLTTGIAEADGQGPMTMKIQPIRPGFGNARDNNYYPAEVVRRDASKFVGVKMYESDHRDDKSTRTWVSTTTALLGFTDEDAPICEVLVHNPGFAQRVRNLKEGGLLDKMECSILGEGKFRPGEVDGRKTNVVEALTRISGIDWVTRAGAGGKALSISESGDDMDKDEKDVKLDKDVINAAIESFRASVQQLKEGDVPKEKPKEEAPTEAPPEEKPLAEKEVAGILAETNLPESAKTYLAETEYENEKSLKEAVAKHIEYLKAVTGSGKPFGHEGGGTEDTMTDEDYDERYAGIMERAGVRQFGN